MSYRNLHQDRSSDSVWNRPRWDGSTDWRAAAWDLAGLAGAALVVGGLRARHSRDGLAVGVGGVLIWGALARGTVGRRAASRLSRLASRRLEGDVVQKASEESFPASDAPSWTPPDA